MTTEYLTVSEVAAILRVNPKRVHALVREGKMRCIQVSTRDRLFKQEHIDEFIEARITKLQPPNTVDRESLSRVASSSKRREGVARDRLITKGKSARAQLLEEMREC